MVGAMSADRSVPRVTRAAMFAALCVLFAAVGHVLMSGTDVPGPALAAAFAGTAVFAWLLAARERGPVLVTGATVGAQAILHGVFSWSQAAAPTTRGSSAGSDEVMRAWAHALLCGPDVPRMSAHAAAQVVRASGLGMPTRMPTGSASSTQRMAGMTGSSTMASMRGMPGMGHGHSDLGMLVAHLLAALLCGLWLAHGERVFFRLVRVLAALRHRCPALGVLMRVLLGRLPSTDLPRVWVTRPARVPRPRGLLLIRALAFRGPPAGAAAA